MRTSIVRPFAGRDRLFDIARLGTIEALERVCGAGMGEILARLEAGVWRHADIRETIHLALRGGGMADAEASQFVVDTVDGAPVAQHLGLAVAIMTAYAHGVDDAVKKPEGPEVGTGAEASPDTPSAPATSPPISPPAP